MGKSGHISGSGGQLDFITGAYMSNGGKSFICMTSTFKDKEGHLKSRFTPTFNGDTVTDPKSQAFYLITILRRWKKGTNIWRKYI